MGKQKGISGILIIILLAALAAVALLVLSNNLTLPQLDQAKVDRSVAPQEAQVTLQSKYQNPFDKNTQYTNPFSDYKNPFDQLK